MSMNSSVLISTTAIIPCYNITMYKGIVYERVVAGVGLLTELFASFSDAFGGRSGRMESQMDNLYQTLLDAMVRKASSIGANGIIGFSIDIDEISGKGTSMLMIQGLGTAVIIEPIVAEMKLDPVNQPKSAFWQCVKCNRVYSKQIKYCAFCGESRHYDWVCSSCKINNGVIDNFCGNCGKAREISEENVPVVHALPNGIVIEDLLIDIEKMKDASEIYRYLLERFGSNENENFIMLLSIMAEISTIERFFGNRKEDSITCLHRFFDHGMHIYVLDRSLEKDTCPECGVEQRSDRTVCCKCGALFHRLVERSC